MSMTPPFLSMTEKVVLKWDFLLFTNRFLIQEILDCIVYSSLRGKRSKGKGKGIRARDHARDVFLNQKPNKQTSHE